jgi:hypothetical protein
LHDLLELFMLLLCRCESGIELLFCALQLGTSGLLPLQSCVSLRHCRMKPVLRAGDLLAFEVLHLLAQAVELRGEASAGAHCVGRLALRQLALLALLLCIATRRLDLRGGVGFGARMQLLECLQ